MALTAHAEALTSSLSQAGLLPGSAPLIPDNFIPTPQLRVSYGDKAVSQGNLFRVSEVKEAPTISFAREDTPSDTGKESYLLLLIDPDAPTPDDPKFAYWRHWVLPGLKPSSVQEDGNGILGQAIESKPALTGYLGPGPKDESRPHRYLFLLFREPEGLRLSKDDVGGEEFVQRRSFRAVEWVEKFGLVLVGVNWMLGAGDGWSE